ncbi:MAG: glutamyl-tRNA reductase [Gordonibacter sp.]|uniref:glutamyl-tRNA reductase n=1 Tax=Gordonibacter sp. TaxID=1968902 RepID=UPI002FCB2C80
MHCIVVGLNIKGTPVELLEKLSVHHSQLKGSNQKLRAAIGARGMVILSTCNRLEYYATCDDVDAGLNAIRSYLASRYATCTDASRASLDDFVYSYADDMAIQHLFDVATGLDSLIVGEAEILGQVSRAYNAAGEAESTDKLMNVWFQRALHLGKKVRTDTSLGRHPVSVGRIAVDLAVKEFGSPVDKQVLILGAGEVCELTMKYLVAYDFPVVMVANRSFEKASVLADEHGFEAYALDALDTCLQKADMVFSATSSKRFMVDRAMVDRAMALRPDRPMVFVDMAMPRDIDPAVADVEGVSVHNISELRDVIDRNRAERALAAKVVQRMIEDEVVDFRTWMQSLQLVPVIAAFRKYADDVKESRLEAALEKLPNLTPSQIHTVSVLATTITNQLVRNPIESLHARVGTTQAFDYAVALQELFGLELEEASRGRDAVGSTRERQAM